MRKLLLWSPLLLFAGIVAATLLGGSGWFSSHSATLQISNRSSATISDISVSLDQASCQIERLQPAASGQCEFRVEADAHYRLSWVEQDARRYQEHAGYVTPGFNFKHAVEFLGDGNIAFKFE